MSEKFTNIYTSKIDFKIVYNRGNRTDGFR